MKQKFAVIGHPIGHTMSPFIHSRLFELSERDFEYFVFDIHPNKLNQEFYQTLKNLDGFNVTIPHKESVLPLIDVIDGSALKYSAVNCVLCKNGKTYGYSTDAFGFLKALETAGVTLNGRVLVLGSGGAARTLAREAADSGCSITIAGRTTDMPKAELLRKWLCDNGAKAETCLFDQIKGHFDLCINATPVGMYPNINEAVITNRQLECCSALFDAVYNPQKTKLMSMAENLGIKTVGGMSMLVWQAVKAHEHWYNAEFETADIKKLITDANQEMTRMFYDK